MLEKCPKIGVRSYASDNLPFGTDNFKQYFTTPQNFGFGEFFYYMKKYKYHEN